MTTQYRERTGRSCRPNEIVGRKGRYTLVKRPEVQRTLEAKRRLSINLERLSRDRGIP